MELENRPKLESYFVLDKDPAPLVIVDFHVYLHSVKLWFEERIEGNMKPEVEDKLIKGAWALKVNRGPDMLPRHPYRIVVIADSRYKDTDNYWRDRFMKDSPIVRQAFVQFAEKKKKHISEIPTHYKGTRSPKTDTFWRIFNIGWEYVNAYFPVFSQEGYEADDIMGAIYRLSRDSSPNSVVKQRQILMSTVDRDWTQCCADEHKVYFANMRVPFPNEKIQERLVGNQGVIEHTKHKMGFDLDHPKNLADWKVKHGDEGDNLPPGSPKCLFDLCEPNPDYAIEFAAPWFNRLRECVNDPKPNIKPEHYNQTFKQFVNICVEPPVKI